MRYLQKKRILWLLSVPQVSKSSKQWLLFIPVRLLRSCPFAYDVTFCFPCFLISLFLKRKTRKKNWRKTKGYASTVIIVRTGRLLFSAGVAIGIYLCIECIPIIQNKKRNICQSMQLLLSRESIELDIYIYIYW